MKYGESNPDDEIFSREHDAEILAWAENRDRHYNESLQSQINEAQEELRRLITDAKATALELEHQKSHLRWLLASQQRFLSGPKFSDRFKP